MGTARSLRGEQDNSRRRGVTDSTVQIAKDEAEKGWSFCNIL